MSETHHSVLPPVNGRPAIRFGMLAPHGVGYFGLRRWPEAVASASGYLWGLCAAVIWSGWWTVTRVGVADGLPAADLAAMRFGLSGLILLPLAWREREAIRGVAPRLLLFMAVGAGAPYALVAGTGVRLTSAAVGGAITVGLLPVFTLILSVLILGERITRGLAFGIACILLGAALVTAGAWDAGRGGYGLFLFVAGALMWAGYTVALRRSGLRPLTATAVVCVASLALYTPVWLATSGPARLLDAAPSDMLVQALYQSLLSAIGALYCFGRAVGRLGAARASVFAAIVPAFSTLIAGVVLHENPSAFEMGGAVLLSGGALVAARGQPNRARKTTPTAFPEPNDPGRQPTARLSGGHLWRTTMTIDTFAPTTFATGARALLDRIGRILAQRARRRETVLTRRALRQLPDSTLRDIGIHPSEIGNITNYHALRGGC